MTGKRKILVPIFYRGHYGRLRPVLRAIEEHPNLELVTITAQQAAYDHFWANVKHSEPRSWKEALSWYVRARTRGFFTKLGGSKSLNNDYLVTKMREDGFRVDETVSFMFDGGTPTVMAKSVGLGIMKIVEVLKRHQPDFVFVNADRFEMMAVTIAAAYLNIPIVHNEAGDISGTIDESVRHAITKFAHVHLAASDSSRNRVIQMGENPDFAFTVGSPAIDTLLKADLAPQGSFGSVDLTKPYLLVLHHPVTTATAAENERTIHEIISVIESIPMQVAVIGANSDARSNVVGPTLQKWYEERKPEHVAFLKSAHPDKFYRLLANAVCAVGNSSSFLREGAFLGTPVVNIGNRQMNRDRGQNVIDVEPEAKLIKAAIQKQLKKGRYERDTMFGTGNAAAQIATILSTVNPPLQKQFYSYPTKFI